MRYLGILGIKFYQRYMRSLHNRECIYNPSCSNYGILSIEKYGLIKGSYYTYLRIKRCNGALYTGGDDFP
ncbi:membrane protein insertion efficiency factor YidD [Leptospira barantonii]|uniref:Membrane protein insertion efficiency factor YidD n=1 Tax=Leptospira barantonii TaxID=2023184 RepID=A0ABX4NK95_9LEPT|nr:membrane protein insertion efficiency factor YidD [Leptospira barantonii]